MKLYRVLVVGLVVACATRAASAAPTALLVVSKSGAADRATITAAVLDVLRAVPWPVADRVAFTDPEVAQILGCLSEDRPWRCVARVIAPKGIERLVVVQVEPKPTEHGSQLVVSGQVVSAIDGVPPYDAVFCPSCTDDLLRASANALAKHLVSMFDSARQMQQPPPSAPRPARRSLALPIGLVAAGGAAIAGGAIALDANQPDRGVPFGTEQPRDRYDTIPGGIAAIAGGAVVAGIGGLLWWRFRHGAAAPAVAITPGGAVVSVGGAF